MGSLARETLRDIEMYLHLLLLISPALGMPSSALIEIGEGIIDQLDVLPGFAQTKAIFKDANLFETVAASLKEAEEAILEMDSELKLLESEEVQFEDNYFPAYNEAKRYLRQSRQNLRGLADRTVKEVKALKIFLKDLDNSNDTVILKVSLDRMKDLMIDTLETLENLNSSIGKQNRKLEKMVTKDSAEYEDWIEKTRGGIYGTIGTTTTSCIIADALGALGICSAISAVGSAIATIVTEVEIAEYAAKLEQLKSITDRMLVAGRDFDTTIHEAIDILTNEIELINNWNNSAEIVNKNIDKYPKEYLKKYVSIRTIFVKGLDDLNKSAEDFLAQPIDIWPITINSEDYCTKWSALSLYFLSLLFHD